MPMSDLWSKMLRDRRVLAAAAAVLLVAIVTLTLWAWARGVADLAKMGKAQAEAGVKSLAAQDATSAGSAFRAASQNFTTARSSLGPEWLAGVAGPIPWAGRQYTSARTLVEIGIDGSNAGIELAKALRRTRDTSGTAGGLAGFLAGGQKNVHSAMALVSSAEHHADSLSADGLVPPLAEAVSSVKSTMREAAPFIKRARVLLQLESYLFSSDHKILVVSQDGAELRPTGGFAGSFGIIDVGPTGVRLETYQDVYTLPDPTTRVPPPPGATMTRNFSFRDANWWIDFPTSARAMLGFWDMDRQPTVAGIIAIDTVAMRDLLGAVGPVPVSSFRETFTSDNLLQRLLYLVEVKEGGKSTRKGVIAALAAELEARLLGASPALMQKSAMALGDAADAKHIQMYFTDSRAQSAADALAWSGRVAPPIGSTDVVAISNAMTWPGKINIAMSKTIDYRVGLEPDRSAETTLVLGFANTGPYPMPMGRFFQDWLRVYRSKGAIFPSATPTGGMTATTVEFGFPAESRTFILRHGQSWTETLEARVPHAVRLDEGSTAARGPGHYRLYFVRQNDLEDIPTTITVTVPPGWHATSASARFIASGKTVPVTTTRDSVRLAVPLSGDLALDVSVALP
jgi:hypothetical protein